MVDDASFRPIVRDDYERIYVVVQALRNKVGGEKERALWEIIRDFHEEYLGPDYPVPLDELIGDEAATAEIHHALIVLEQLKRGKTDIPVHDRSDLAIETECSVDGCANLTNSNLCLHHELEADQ